MKKILFAVAVLIAAISSCAKTDEKVILGDERADVYLPLLEGKRVALFSNQSGIVGDKITGSKLADDVAVNGVTDENSTIPFLEPSEEGGKIEYGPHILDVLLSQGVDVRAIFSPEHGFRGNADAGELVSSSVDEKTGVEILSLYEKGSHVPSKENMDKFDVLVVDIQDVGLRYYTYYITMHHLMEACARYGKKMVVLDRPNPNGFYVDGPILDTANFKSGIGWLPIPTVHGMTMGELAQMINGEGWLPDGAKCDLEVVPCLNYTHQTKYSLILPPSPNLKDMKAVYLYSSTCCFEGTEATTGRGTQYPFEIYGHPDMKNCQFTFTPRSIPGAKTPRYQDQLCHGVDLRSKPLEAIWSEKVSYEYVIDAYRKMNVGDSFFLGHNSFELRVGAGYIRQMIEDTEYSELTPAELSAKISARSAADVEAFKVQRRPYLLYSE
jgi:uncharacterized protein YbbC (DUF1343 family)